MRLLRFMRRCQGDVTPEEAMAEVREGILRLVLSHIELWRRIEHMFTAAAPPVTGKTMTFRVG